MVKYRPNSHVVSNLRTVRQSRRSSFFHVCLFLTLIACSLPTLSNAGDLDQVVDVFFKRYKDYPQLYQDMSFIVGNWDFLEAKLRKEMADVFNNRYRVYPGETAIGQSIINVCNRRSLPYGMQYTFHVVDMPGINAFAIPGGGVYITKAFIDEIYRGPNPEARLAFVFGHEVAHITERHWISSLKKHYTGEFWNWAASELSRKNNIEFLRQIIPSILEAVYAGYSREHEREADSLGMLYMVRAGFDLEGAVDALEMLAGLGTGGYTIWSSHPKIQERVQTARRIKTSFDSQVETQVRRAVEQCSGESGILSVSIHQPSGYFPEIGTEVVFDEFAVLFFRVDKIRDNYKEGSDLSIPMLAAGRPGKYHRELPEGDYVLFFKARAMKRWFTPYKAGIEGWGPLRVTVRPKSISQVQFSPIGGASQVYDYTWNVPSKRSAIDYEFFHRFVLDSRPEEHFGIDFAPLPSSSPTKKNIDVSGSAAIQEGTGCLILSGSGLELLSKFRIEDGTPLETRLTVTCSSPIGSRGMMSISVNGKALVTNQTIESSKPMAFFWDMTDLTIVGTNTVSIVTAHSSNNLLIHTIDIDAIGAGIGSFYKL